MENIFFESVWFAGAFFFLMLITFVLVMADILLYAFTKKSVIFTIEKWLFK